MRYPGRQKGVVLIFSLIILLVLTGIGVTAMRMTTMQEQMAGGYRDRQLAFQGAEAALREGERLLNQATIPNFTNEGQGGLYASGFAPSWDEFDEAEVRRYRDGNEDNPINQMLATPPEYYVERLDVSVGHGASLGSDVALEDNDLFQVTARSRGATGQSTVVLQSVYKR